MKNRRNHRNPRPSFLGLRSSPGGLLAGHPQGGHGASGDSGDSGALASGDTGQDARPKLRARPPQGS